MKINVHSRFFMHHKKSIYLSLFFNCKLCAYNHYTLKFIADSKKCSKRFNSDHIFSAQADELDFCCCYRFMFFKAWQFEKTKHQITTLAF